MLLVDNIKRAEKTGFIVTMQFAQSAIYQGKIRLRLPQRNIHDDKDLGIEEGAQFNEFFSFLRSICT